MSDKIDNGGYVYPPSFKIVKKPYEEAWPEPINGITRRDWLAGLAMQGMLSNCEMSYDFAGAAEDSYKYADAMIAESKKGGDK